jgi:FKBP-type peptidyl-prolyl cis-trans isomerase FkpA
LQQRQSVAKEVNHMQSRPNSILGRNSRSAPANWWLALALGLGLLASAHVRPAQALSPDKPALVSQELRPKPDSALSWFDLREGKGPTAADGMRLKVHYTGWLYEPAAPQGLGKQFDSSIPRKTPFEFVLGAHQVIRGWEEAVAGLKVGGKRRVFIAPELAYGERGAGGVIPPNATLVFDIELLALEPAP